MAKIDAFFNLMFEQKASDLHLSSNNNPMLRINGELQRVVRLGSTQRVKPELSHPS